MSDLMREAIEANPGLVVFVVREEALVSLTDKVAEVQVETLGRLGVPPPPPHVSTVCKKVLRDWTFSGSRSTEGTGKTSIHLNKFLPTCIEQMNNEPILIGSYPSFTVTPEAEEPVFLTCTITATPQAAGFYIPSPRRDYQRPELAARRDGSA